MHDHGGGETIADCCTVYGPYGMQDTVDANLWKEPKKPTLRACKRTSTVLVSLVLVSPLRQKTPVEIPPRSNYWTISAFFGRRHTDSPPPSGT